MKITREVHLTRRASAHNAQLQWCFSLRRDKGAQKRNNYVHLPCNVLCVGSLVERLSDNEKRPRFAAANDGDAGRPCGEEYPLHAVDRCSAEQLQHCS